MADEDREIGLRIYGLAAQPGPARARGWALLEPRLVELLERHVEVVATHAPVFREMLSAQGRAFLELAREGTWRLFTGPLDPAYIAAARARAATEAELGFDMRARVAVNQVLLCGLGEVVAALRWPARRRGPALLDEATRLFHFDVVTSIAMHHGREVRAARAGGAALNAAIDVFASAVGEAGAATAEHVAGLGATATRLSRLADSAAIEAGKAAGAASGTAAHVATVAAATEELSASIGEIHGQATRSADMARRAVEQAGRIDETIRSLADAVSTIGSVVGMISEIAAQTNLLALNATIEAARAGKAGRGFAVVASEVKSLATQTAGATDDIARQITLIQAATRRSVDEIGQAGGIVGSIAEIARAVAAAVNEQASATGSIAESTSGAAANASTVADALRTVEASLAETLRAAGTTLDTARALDGRSGQVAQAIDQLLAVAAEHGTLKTMTRLAGPSQAA